MNGAPDPTADSTTQPTDSTPAQGDSPQLRSSDAAAPESGPTSAPAQTDSRSDETASSADNSAPNSAGAAPSSAQNDSPQRRPSDTTVTGANPTPAPARTDSRPDEAAATADGSASSAVAPTSAPAQANSRSKQTKSAAGTSAAASFPADCADSPVAAHRDSSLNAARRARELRELGDGETIDVLVVGGGVTGVGVALDAAARGLRTVLVERHDLAFGTSRWSSKLVHGGLRYLASGGVGIAHESAVERGVLLQTTAPHLTRPVPQLVPLLPGVGRKQRALVRTGFVAGDVLRRTAGTSDAILPRSRRVAAAEALRLAPTVRRNGLRGGLLAWDGQLVDDARLVVAIARTAAAHGASVLTRVEATTLTDTSATLRDTLTGETVTVAARAVINATGVWADELDPSISLRPSRGTHLVFDAAAFGGLTAALTVPIPGSTSRFVFAFPAAHGRVYLGLTDEDAPGPIPDEPRPTDTEITFLLDTVNTVLREPLQRSDIRGSFAGLRPLLRTDSDSTADISREHAVLTNPGAPITVVGGKLTTYRRMAEDAVDAAVSRAGLTAGPCATTRIPLVGAVSGAARDAIAAPPVLIERYGSEATRILELAERNPELAEPVAPGIDVLRAEFAYAVAHEGALDESDLLDRRSRIGLVSEDRSAAAPAARAAIRAL